MSNRRGANIPWWAIVLGFLVFWPVGLVLLLLSLGGTNSSQETPRPAGQGAQTAAGQGAAPGRQARPSSAPASGAGSKARQRFFRTPGSGKLMAAIGAVMSLAFSAELVEELSFALSSGRFLAYIGEWFPSLGFLGAGLFLLFLGLSNIRFARRTKLYQGVVGQRDCVRLADLASAAGVPESRLIADLQRMLAEGYLPLGYIDRAAGQLVLTDRGYQPPAPQASPPQSGEKSADRDILQQIRRVNDAISDPEMSRKIDRIEEIAGHILDYRRQNPGKTAQLRQFLDYYLPTTLQLLQAYVQLDSQGVEGENISAAKARIEGIMDKVAEGFEKQLDQLFQADALDIAADVDVLERMLERDGLGSGMSSPGL